MLVNRSTTIDSLEDCFRPSLILIGESYSEDDLLLACKQLWTINQALDQFIYGDMSEDDFCDILEDNGQNMDEYLDIAIDNVESHIIFT